MSEQRVDIDRQRPISAGGVAKVGLILYVVSAFLNSSNLEQMANRMPTGSTAREPAVAAAKALHKISGVLGLTEPGVRVDAYRGITPPPAEGAGTAFGSDTTIPEPVDSTVPADPNAAPTDTVAPADVPVTEPPVTAPRPATAADPAKVYIGGDSLVQAWGSVVQRLAQGTGVISVPSLDYKAATGLARPDSYDWPSRLVQQMRDKQPQVAIVGFGGNDGQGLLINGKAFQPGVPEWAAEYGRRVGETMDYLSRGGRHVIWVGTPIPKDAADFARQSVINQVVRDEVAKRPSAVTLVDTWSLFSNEENQYAEYMIDEIDGKAKLMRQNDGFHLSIPGGERLGRLVFEALKAQLRI
jgi:uncharacterized protein